MKNSEISALIVSCARAHRAIVTRKLRALGLFVGQDILLAHLAETGPVSQKALSSALNVEQATISESVKKMAAAGLVERVSDPNDGRAYLVAVTDEGRRLAAEVDGIWSAQEARMLSGLSEQDVAQMKKALQSALAQLT